MSICVGRPYQCWAAEVVETVLAEDLSTSLEPDRLAELNTSLLLQDLGEDHTESAKQSPARVDQLQLTVALEGLSAAQAPITATLRLSRGR